MVINFKERPSLPFYKLIKGDLFAVVDESAVDVKFYDKADNVFMKLMETTFTKDEGSVYDHSAIIPNDEGLVNAVQVVDGTLVYINEEEPVLPMYGKLDVSPV